MDVTGAADLYVNRIARGIAPIRMTGNYGSEIVRGNVAFKAKPLNGGIFSREFTGLGEQAAGCYRREAEVHPVSFIAFKQVPWHHYCRLSVEQTQLTMRAPYLDNELVALMYRAPREAVLSKAPSWRVIVEGKPELGRIPTDRGIRFPAVPGLTAARHLYEQFTFNAEYAYDYGMPAWLARVDHGLAPLHLERVFLGRHKFSHFRVWYRDQLGGYVKEVLLDSRTRGRPYLQGSRLEEMVNGHLKGDRNYTVEIHKILTTELIQRGLVERKWEGAE
jgi:asparagine synthase (glutamine-hydrolysing)